MINYKDFFGIEYPILQATMTHNGDWPLAAAISEAGGLGVISPSGDYTADWVDQQIINLKKHTSKPFSVAIFQRPWHVEKMYLKNCKDEDLKSEDHKYIIKNLEEGIKEVDKQLDVVLDHGVKVVQALGSEPKERLVKLCKQKNVKILAKFHSYKGIDLQKVKALGADAVVLKGREAAGYIGRQPSLEQITNIDKNVLPVISSGGISTSEDIQEHLDRGAMAVMIGTRFVCAKESSAHIKYKNTIINSSNEDVKISHDYWKKDYPRPTRAIMNEQSNKWMNEHLDILKKTEDNKISTNEANQLLLRLPSKKNPRAGYSEKLFDALTKGDIENGPVMIGKNINHITEQESVSDIMKKLTRELKI